MRNRELDILGSIAVLTLIVLIVPGGVQHTEAGAILNGVTIYVDWEAPAANDGSSWDDAFIDLQLALDVASPGDEVWVAAGTYYPSVEVGGTGDRYKIFQMLNEVGIYGGFDPSVGDVDWEDRDWVNNVTALSGDIGVPGDNSDNCYHVFYHPEGMDLDSMASLDGFVIADGNADADWPHDSGGGMYNYDSSPTLTNCTFRANAAAWQGGGMYNYNSSPALTNCTFEGNHGFVSGGMYNTGSSPALANISFDPSYAKGGGMYNEGSSPSLTNCTFEGNSVHGGSHGFGGGMYNHDSSPTLIDCMFEGNSATGCQSGFGGGMYNSVSSPTLTNCTFSDNSAWGIADGYGGGIAGWSSSARLTNCTFSDNSAHTVSGGSGHGGGMYIQSSSPTLTNCILWADFPDELHVYASSPDVTYSDIQGGYPGTGNIDANPLFVDPGSGDHHLGYGSPCIDAGTNHALDLAEYDFEGDPRIIDGNCGGAVVDMGIDEAPQAECSHLPLVLSGAP